MKWGSELAGGLRVNQPHHEKQTQCYRPGAYHEFYIYEPKRRKISAAPYRDRVVHHALCNVIEPIFDRTFFSSVKKIFMWNGKNAVKVHFFLDISGFRRDD